MTTPNGTVIGKREIGLIAYGTVCASIVAILFLTNWPSYNFYIRGGLPIYWYYSLACVFVIPILFAEPGSAMRIFKAPLFWWFILYVLLGVLWLLAAQNFIEEANRLWRLRVLAFLLFCATFILVLHSKHSLLGLITVGCVFLASAFNWLDVMRPYKFVPQGVEGANPGRGAGMFMNANSAGEIIVIGTIVALPFIPMRFRAVALAAMVVGVAPTLSRGGLILAAVVVLGAIAFKLVNRIQGVASIIAVALLITATTIYYDKIVTAADSPLEKTITRLGLLSGEEEEDVSVEARRWAARQARDLFLDEPLFGHGIGATTREEMIDGPHNMYLMLMAEQGLPGLALYLSLLIVLFISGRQVSRRASAREGQDVGRAMCIYSAVLLVDGLFSHNVLEEPYGMFAMAFIAAAGLQSLRQNVAVEKRMQTPFPRIKWRRPSPTVLPDAPLGGSARETMLKS